MTSRARRLFQLFALVSLLGASCVQPAASASRGHTTLYAAVGPELSWWTVDEHAASLERRGSAVVPAQVQFAWPHPSGRFLYVAWSDQSPASRGTMHGVTAFAIDAASGALVERGSATRLRSRPIHLTTDADGTHLIVAYNDPSGVTVLALARDGSIGDEIAQARIDAGVYAHQVRVDASGSTAYLVTRGIGPTAATPEQPGAIKIFRYAGGRLTDERSVAPNGGFGFQPRNLDFHPTKPWAYVVLERQNALQQFEHRADGSLSSAASASASTLEHPLDAVADQVAGAVIVHPNGRVAYVANRASGTRDVRGTRVFSGGVNAIATFSLDARTGAPTLVENVATHGFSPRTMALDARGSILVAANQSSMRVAAGDSIVTVPASLAVYRVDADGRLAFVRTYDVETTAERALLWVGILTTP